MQKNSKISSSQLLSLMVLFELGSAIVVGLGMKAKQDAWLAILFGMFGGMFIFLFYVYLQKTYPKLPLTSYLQKILGKFPGKILACLYILYFTYIAARVLRDFGELIVTTALQGTPLIVVNLFIILVVAYGSYLGAEVLGRAGEIFVVIILMILALFTFFTFASNLPKSQNLLPVLENGWKPVLNVAFPLVLTFPFGETIVFTMFFSQLNNPKKALKVGETAILLSGLILSLIIALNISILGPATTANTTFPLLKSLGKVSIGNFIQRLDSIAIIVLIVGGFFKIVIFTYAAISGCIDIFNIKNKLFIIILVCTTILAVSIKIASNILEHLKVGLEQVPIYIHLPFQVGIPLTLCIIVILRRRNI